MKPSEPLDSRALTELTALLRDNVKQPRAGAHERGLAALRARIAIGQSSPGVKRRWTLVALSAALAGIVATLLFVLVLRREPVPETLVSVERIEGGEMLEGGYLSESGHGGMKLWFNEGSAFVLMPGARGRVREVGQHGAQLALEHGTASFQITHRPQHRWSVEAGPFLVTVEGTEFTVRWEPASEQFELKLKRGRVTVSGPVIGKHLSLRAGQKLSVNLAKAETLIAEERGTALAPSAAVAGTVVPPASSGMESSRPSPASARAPAPAAAASSERGWREAFANGQWDRILADVEREGLDATLSTASSDELFALADAARYRRRADLARAALLSHRRRFPGSSRSVDAMFLLGRVEELRESGSAPAIRWYDEYLARAPAGTYAAEALGRKMILTNAASGAASARRIADEYLRRFPRGSHAGAARALKRAP